MKTRSALLIFCLVIACCLALATAAFTQTVGKDSCLKCHGPFDKLAGAKPSYKAESGEIINPHVYVPHDKKEPRNIPDCLNCHKPHPLDTKSAEMKKAPRPEVKYCFSCHHTNNFASCKSCHQ